MKKTIKKTVLFSNEEEVKEVDSALKKVNKSIIEHGTILTFARFMKNAILEKARKINKGK